MPDHYQQVLQFSRKHGFPIDSEGAFEPWAKEDDDAIEAAEFELEEALSHLKSRLRDEKQDWRVMRLRLMIEEVKELATALRRCDEIEAFDASLDISYVAVGNCVTWGWPYREGFAEVHRSNMTKDPANGSLKPKKGRGYEEPNLGGLLWEAQKHRRTE